MLDESTRSQLSTTLTVVLALALVVAVAATVYLAVFPPETAEPFSEYYLLGPDGNASDYPGDLSPGESGVVIVGISNHEHEPVTYRSVVAWNDTVTRSYNVTVGDDETTTRRLELTAPSEPGRYNVTFMLYEDGESGVAEWTRLWIDVGHGDDRSS